MLAPILSFWNPYNVSLRIDELEFEKHRLGSYFVASLHAPTENQSSLGHNLASRSVSIGNRDGPVRDNYPGLAAGSGNFDWSVLMRMNASGQSGGGPIILKPGEMRVFSVASGNRPFVDPSNDKRLILYLKAFELDDLVGLRDFSGFVFENTWDVDIRNPYDGTPIDPDEELTEEERKEREEELARYNAYEAILLRITEPDGSYNPELVISMIPKDGDIQTSGGAIDVLIRSGGESHRVSRNTVRFTQGGYGSVWNMKDAMDAYPLEGIWPRNFWRDMDYWMGGRGHPVQMLYGEQHGFIMTDFFLKPENYQVTYSTSSGRGSGRFPVPVTGFFNATSSMQWNMTGIQSPHPVSDIWDGVTTVIDGDDWTSVPPFPGAEGFEPEDEVIDPDGKAYWGRAYDTRSPEAANRVILREVPTAPSLSVGAFRHANLGLHDHQPMYTAGESFPSPYVPPDRVWETGPFQAGQLYRWTHSTMVNHRTLVDWTYLVNEALWDRFYFSGIAPDVASGRDLETVLSDFLDTGRPLANSRIALIPGRATALEAAVDEADGLPTAESPRIPSFTTLNRGAFNVNSTSVEAWKGILSATLGLTALQREGSSLRDDGSYEVPFPRQSIPVAASEEFVQTWQKHTGLSANQIDALAKALVEAIRERGPFTSLSDFINRRLAPAGDPSALAGTIQAALDTVSGINDATEFTASGYLRPDPPLSHSGMRTRFLPEDFPYPEHLRTRALRQAAVSYLTQGDILQVLGPALSARSDTFSIICYGDAVHPVTGEVRARAYAEAIVQRFPDPVNPSADDAYEPEDPEQFGRRFRLISFNWLSEEVDLTR